MNEIDTSDFAAARLGLGLRRAVPAGCPRCRPSPPRTRRRQLVGLEARVGAGMEPGAGSGKACVRLGVGSGKRKPYPFSAVASKFFIDENVFIQRMCEKSSRT